MAKQMPDKLGKVLSGNSAAAAAPTGAATGGTGKAKMTAHHINIRDDDWQLLQRHFEDQGTPVSVGIRQMIAQFLKREGLR